MSSKRAAKPSLLHWHEPGTSKEEKWLIRKLDIFILTYSCLCFFIKYLDTGNVSNAYVSGMKEELNLRERCLCYVPRSLHDTDRKTRGQ